MSFSVNWHIVILCSSCHRLKISTRMPYDACTFQCISRLTLSLSLSPSISLYIYTNANQTHSIPPKDMVVAHAAVRFIGTVEDLHELFFSVVWPDGSGAGGVVKQKIAEEFLVSGVF